MDLKAMMDHRFLLLLSLAYSLIAIISTAGRCLAGWENSGKFCYMVDASEKTYGEARDACEEKNMDHSRLASILDAEEQAFVHARFGVSRLGIGLKRDMSGKFTWEDGSTFNYAKWHPDHPIPLYMCAITFYGGWFMVKCGGTTNSYLCKAPADSSGECAAGWEKFLKFCYIADESEKTYEEAKDACKEKGMYHSRLASILDREEQLFVDSRFEALHLWIGLKRDISGEFTWEDRSTFSFTMWEYGGPRHLQLCVQNYNNTWYSVRCDYATAGHLCKAPALSDELRNEIM